MTESTKKFLGKSKVSSVDVAQAAGVSQSTVSRVLSGRQINLIGAATREKVLKVALELGYQPNPIAQALRGSRSNLLGVIVREISDPFFSKLISQLSVRARLCGYHIVLGHAGSDPVEAFELKSYLDMSHTDGVILVGDLKDDEILLNRLIEQGRPVLALCRGPSPALLHTINTDNRLGVSMLMDHLIQLGHRRIGFINGGWLGDIRERLDAYRELITLKHLEFNPQWVQTDINTAQGGYQATSRLLKLTDRPTAIIASDDVMAAGVIRCLVESGIEVPEQMSVTGFDDIDISQFITPTLTTIKQPIEVLNQQAMELMIEMINEPDRYEDQFVRRFTPELIVRGSTGKVPQQKVGIN